MATVLQRLATATSAASASFRVLNGRYQLVYIATPPFLTTSKRDALRAGKHVIVEKSLAVTMEQADELVSIAPDQRLLLVTNLMQRYNPRFGQIKELVDSKLLSDVKREQDLSLLA